MKKSQLIEKVRRDSIIIGNSMIYHFALPWKNTVLLFLHASSFNVRIATLFQYLCNVSLKHPIMRNKNPVYPVKVALVYSKCIWTDVTLTLIEYVEILSNNILNLISTFNVRISCFLSVIYTFIWNFSCKWVPNILLPVIFACEYTSTSICQHYEHYTLVASSVFIKNSLKNPNLILLLTRWSTFWRLSFSKINQ